MFAAHASPTKFQRWVVVDSENTRVQITLFNDSIRMYQERLELFGTYYISNASVRPVLAMYSFEGSQYQWSMHSRCVVQKVIGEAPVVLYAFERIDRLPDYIETQATVDMLLIVLKMLHRKQLSTRNGCAPYQEMIVVDRSMKPLVLTFWDEFLKEEVVALAAIIEQKPIISAMRLSVAAYNGISIRTKSASSLQINPAIPPVVGLRGWLFDNLAAINALLESPKLEALARDFGKDATNELRTISYVHGHTNLKFFHVRCRLDMLDMGQSLVRNYCASCDSTTSALPAEVYTCNLCQKDVTSLTGARVEVIGVDASGSFPLTLYGDDVASFLGFETEASLLAHFDGKAQPFETFLCSGSGKEYTIQVKAHNTFYMGSTHRKFVARFFEMADASGGSSVGALETSGNTAGMNVTDTLRELTAIQASAEDGEFEISAEDTAFLRSILSRQKLKGKASKALLSGTHSLSSVATNMEDEGVSRPSSEVVCCETPVSNALLSTVELNDPPVVVPLKDVSASAPVVRLDDDNEWEMLMKGPPPEPVTVGTPSHSAKHVLNQPATRSSVQKDGKDRAPTLDKESPKAMRKLDM